jgi:SAM-dependent methyltransferase
MNIVNDNWDVSNYQEILKSTPKNGELLLKFLNPQLGEKILDVGCGEGSLTKKIQAHACDVVGIDSSYNMIECAKVNGINAQFLDIRVIQFEEKFDAVFSNATLHWIKEYDVVIANIARALKKGGRFIADFGCSGNTRIIESAIIQSIQNAGYAGQFTNPWHFHSPLDIKSALEHHGLKAENLLNIKQLTIIPNGMRHFLITFAGQFLTSIPQEKHGTILNEAENLMYPYLCNNGTWYADYSRLWVKAFKI